MVPTACPVEVVRLVAQQVEKLGVHERRHKIEGAVRVGENEDVYKRQPMIRRSDSFALPALVDRAADSATIFKVRSGAKSNT